MAIGNKAYKYDWMLVLGISLTVFFGVMLFIESMIIIAKPFDYKNFKINYFTK